jgi:Protein of unknown function (DUF2628)
MARYLVLLPAAETSIEARLKGAIFVREGFSYWAFLLGPFWFARHGHFLVALIYLVTLGAIGLALDTLGIEEIPTQIVMALIMGLIGLEAANLRVRDLEWRGFILSDLRVGDDLQSLERRFFEDALRPAAMVERAQLQPGFPNSRQSVAFGQASAIGKPSIIGLFPKQGGVE